MILVRCTSWVYLGKFRLDHTSGWYANVASFGSGMDCALCSARGGTKRVAWF
jgi:hypothetical protein